MVDTIYNRLVFDLGLIGLPVNEVELKLRPYSKKYFGNYYVSYDEKKPKVVLYIYEDERRSKYYSYDSLLDTAIHEMCHHLQWRDPNFVRVAGVAHDSVFYKYYDMYIRKAKEMEVMQIEYSGKNEAA